MKTAPPTPEDQAGDLLKTLRKSRPGLTLAQLLERHPQVARRTAQRWIRQWIDAGQLLGQGEGRARRYVATTAGAAPAGEVIPLSADSRDILAYVDQPLQARKPVGYQHEFLAQYRPNHSWYLPEPMRRQLRKMGATGQAERPAGTHGRAVLNRLLIDLSWASSHLEGNTYSRLDTRELIEHGKAAQGKAAAETQMILNHKAAIEMLVENAASAGFNRYTLLNLHSALAENLLPNPADEGRVRQHAVEIGSSVYRPLSVPQQIDATLDLLLGKAQEIADPFEQSFFMMVHLPYLQPFADVNKRTSRLAANLPLFRANLCPLTFLDVPEPAYSRAILGVYRTAARRLRLGLRALDPGVPGHQAGPGPARPHAPGLPRTDQAGRSRRGDPTGQGPPRPDWPGRGRRRARCGSRCGAGADRGGTAAAARRRAGPVRTAAFRACGLAVGAVGRRAWAGESPLAPRELTHQDLPSGCAAPSPRCQLHHTCMFMMSE